jgi:hypothetical protein
MTVKLPPPHLRMRQRAERDGRALDPTCEFKPYCGDPVDGRICDTCMIPADLGPEPTYKDRTITQPCKPCLGCGREFVVQSRNRDGDTARVYGDRGDYRRYHPGCSPWAKPA